MKNSSFYCMIDPLGVVVGMESDLTVLMRNFNSIIIDCDSLCELQIAMHKQYTTHCKEGIPPSVSEDKSSGYYCLINKRGHVIKMETKKPHRNNEADRISRS